MSLILAIMFLAPPAVAVNGWWGWSRRSANGSGSRKYVTLAALVAISVNVCLLATTFFQWREFSPHELLTLFAVGMVLCAAAAVSVFAGLEQYRWMVSIAVVCQLIDWFVAKMPKHL